MNWAELDSVIKSRDAGVIREAISYLGYDYLSEAIYDLYYNKKKPLSQTATAVGLNNEQSVQVRMKAWGWERRGKGGDNHKGAMHRHADEVRAEYAAGKTTMSVLARRYGVSVETISNIVHRRTFKNV